MTRMYDLNKGKALKGIKIIFLICYLSDIYFILTRSFSNE
jgi:hypothetical protein